MEYYLQKRDFSYRLVGDLEFKNVGTSQCLDGKPWEKNDWLLYVHPCNNGENQKWIIDGSNPRKAVRHKVSGMCLVLDFYGTGYPIVDKCNPRAMYQQWSTEGVAGRTSFIANNGKCLDTDGTKVFLSNFNETKNENNRRWSERAL
jgi:hypothetical protein